MENFYQFLLGGKKFSRHFIKTFIKPSVENIMNRAEMEHYNILKTSLERFGKCQWNIKVYKINRVVASSIECFPQDKNIVVEETDSLVRSIDAMLGHFSFLIVADW